MLTAVVALFAFVQGGEENGDEKRKKKRNEMNAAASVRKLEKFIISTSFHEAAQTDCTSRFTEP